jgi:CxxC motif-containing protein (DUF1111 family)
MERTMVTRSVVGLSAVASILIGTLISSPSYAVLVAKDPGVRGGAAGAGGFVTGLTAGESQLANDSREAFEETEGLADGLGPRFNGEGCAQCHAFPASGGSSPATNPQVAVATHNGAKNTVPSFITASGPVREARFVKKADGTSDGGVHDLFVISGRSDPATANTPATSAAGCTITQEDFATQVNNNNVIFRIPTPNFGIGLIESITDKDLAANLAANNAQKVQFGIFGQINHVSGDTNNNGNDGTAARFGWKAQNKSGMLFSGEAYNVEMGISNELFQTEREEDPNCQFKTVPNDHTNTESIGTTELLSDVEQFSFFMRVLAPPTPVTSYTGANGAVTSTSIANGKQRFQDVGCHLCHTIKLHTNPQAQIAALADKDIFPYSDFAIHNMGPGLADGVSQGQAKGDQFRSAPLWGLGQRIFLLHDGRTKDLRTAIDAHASAANSQFGASEANTVVQKFDALNGDDTQDLFNFLRSL